MVNVNTKFDGDLWFFTHRLDPKVEEIKRNPQVNASFVSPKHPRYVSVSGRASLVEERKRIELLWTDACQAWFPKGREDLELALLRIDVDFAEYWDDSLGVGEQRGKFEQGSALAGYEAWEHSTESLNDDDPKAVVHNPTPSML